MGALLPGIRFLPLCHLAQVRYNVLPFLQIDFSLKQTLLIAGLQNTGPRRCHFRSCLVLNFRADLFQTASRHALIGSIQDLRSLIFTVGHSASSKKHLLRIVEVAFLPAYSNPSSANHSQMIRADKRAPILNTINWENSCNL